MVENAGTNIDDNLIESEEGREILLQSLRFRLRNVTGDIKVISGSNGDFFRVTVEEICAHDVESENVLNNYAIKILDLVQDGYNNETSLIEYLVVESAHDGFDGELMRERIQKTIDSFVKTGILTRNGDILKARIKLPDKI